MVLYRVTPKLTLDEGDGAGSATPPHRHEPIIAKSVKGLRRFQAFNADILLRLTMQMYP